jgi:hypothetical protein
MLSVLAGPVIVSIAKDSSILTDHFAIGVSSLSRSIRFVLSLEISVPNEQLFVSIIGAPTSIASWMARRLINLLLEFIALPIAIALVGSACFPVYPFKPDGQECVTVKSLG